MKKHWLKSAAGIFLLLLSAQAMGGQSNCVFDAKNFSESRFKNDKKISRYTLDKSSREVKIITKDGSLISAKYWACEHYGTHAVMLIGPYPKDDLDALDKKFIQLADIALEANEAGIVKSYLMKNPLSLSTEARQINLPNIGYSEFYLGYGVIHDSIVLEIKFYRD